MIRTRRIAAAAAAGVFTLTFAGAAFAVSDGNYNPEDQRCSGQAEDTVNGDVAEPDCQTVTLYVSDGRGAGHELARVGVMQTPEGQFGHDVRTETNPGFYNQNDDSFIDPTTGMRVYFGADDNLDGGEHDGSTNAAHHGPSDGGGVQFNATPGGAEAWFAALTAGDAQYLFTHHAPVDAGVGSCADGICENVQTQRRTIHQGTGDGSRNAADYEGKEWDPKGCGGSIDESKCGPGGIAAWDAKEGEVHADPGVSVYEDPDPQGSPIGPYPLVGAYAGSCGVIVGGQSGMPAAPASPVTNGAGQVDAANPACD